MKVTAGQLEYGFGKCAACGFLLPLAEFRQWTPEDGQLRRPRVCIVCETGKIREQGISLNLKRKVYPKRGGAYYKKQTMIQNAKDKPCADCGQKFPLVCMEFDHRPEHKKEYNIASMMNNAEALILAEIAKCDIVCACCHRIRSAARGWSGGRKPRRANDTSAQSVHQSSAVDRSAPPA